jgi:hypothetical protein
LVSSLLKASDPDTGQQLTAAENFSIAMGFMYRTPLGQADFTVSPPLTLLLRRSHSFCIYVWQLPENGRDFVTKFDPPSIMPTKSTDYQLRSYLSSMQLFTKVVCRCTSLMTGTRIRTSAPANLIRETPAEGMVIAGHFVPGHVYLH